MNELCLWQFMSAKRSALKGFLKEKAGKKGTLNRDEIVEMFKQCDLDLPREYLEYILTTIILGSKSINQLAYLKIFDVFD